MRIFLHFQPEQYSDIFYSYFPYGKNQDILFFNCLFESGFNFFLGMPSRMTFGKKKIPLCAFIEETKLVLPETRKEEEIDVGVSQNEIVTAPILLQTPSSLSSSQLKTITRDFENVDLLSSPSVNASANTPQEEKVSLPVMTKELFITTFLEPVKRIMFEIRAFHLQQGKNSKTSRCTSDDILKRCEFSEKLISSFALEEKMEGYDSLQLSQIEDYIINSRCHSSFSLPMNLQRFCPDDGQCKLFTILGWCDMNHISSLKQGDIIYAPALEMFDHETTCSLMMLKDINSYNGWNMEKSPLFLCRLPQEERKSSFFCQFEQRMKNMHLYSWIYDRERYELSDFCITNNFKSKMVCKWTEFSRWIKSFYHETITVDQCQELYHFGEGSNNFLNLLLNGMLSKNILSHFLKSGFLTEKNKRYEVTTVALLESWIQEFGPQDVWMNLSFCCIRYGCNHKKPSEKDLYRPVLTIPATIEEVKSAVEIYDFLLKPDETVPPKCAIFPITTRKLNQSKISQDFEIFKIVIEFYLRSDGSEDLESLNPSDYFHQWMYKRNHFPRSVNDDDE